MGLPNNATAGGSLIQTGSTINGILYVDGSPCFDPVADELIVTGKASNDGSNTVTFSSAPIRGQVLTVNGSVLPLSIIPPNLPQFLLDGSATISGGACAGQVDSQLVNLSLTNNWSINVNAPPPTPTGTANLTQSAPDGSGISHVTGTFTFMNTSCFTSGTVFSSRVLGDSLQMTINTDTGQLVGSGTFDVSVLMGGPDIRVIFSAAIQGGTCNGQMLSFLLV